jgi:hypothetical protein
MAFAVPITQDDIDRQIGKLVSQLQPGMELNRVSATRWIVRATGEDELNAQFTIAEDVTPDGAIKKAFAVMNQVEW